MYYFTTEILCISFYFAVGLAGWHYNVHLNCVMKIAQMIMCNDAVFLQQHYWIFAFSASVAWSNWPTLKKKKKILQLCFYEETNYLKLVWAK